ncbi:MAG: hypothetical protein LBP83_05125 [Dysgonamonadaceae bacterium]|jgi:hypothetical protein|nr:hypothetical protein [Dysgonamonadaceae bacterium]
MSQKGYIKLNRKFFQSFLWNEAREYSKAKAWVDLIQLARFEASTEIINGKVIEVQRGELPASRRFLELRWRWGSTQVSNFLKMLSNLGMINRRTNQGQTIIKLLNYDVYNDTQTTDKPPNKPATNQRQTSDKPEANQNKEREERNNLNLNNNPPTPLREAGGGLDFLISVFSKIEIRDNASMAHNEVIKSLLNNGFACRKGFAVNDRCDGREGRIDIFAEKDGVNYAIEIDRINAREKSISKLKSIENALKIILLRGGERFEIEGIDLVFPLRIQTRETNGLDFSFVEKTFKTPFGDWLEYKKGRSETYKTQKSLQACYRKLKKLSGDNPVKAAEIVEESMSNNWAGLFEPKAGKTNKPDKLSGLQQNLKNKYLNKTENGTENN